MTSPSSGLLNQDGVIGGNLPADPTYLKQRDDNTNKKNLLKYFTDILRWVNKFDEHAEKRRHHMMFLAEEYWNNRQDGFMRDNKWTTPDYDNDGIVHQADYFGEVAQRCIGDWVAARIGYQVTSADNSSKGWSAARGGSQFVSYYDLKFNTPLEEQLTGQNAVLHGNYGFRTYYDPLASPYGNKSVKVPKYQIGQMENRFRSFSCPDCQASGDLSQATPVKTGDGSADWFSCPECGNAVNAMGVESFSSYDYEEVEYQLGDIVSKRISPFLLSVDPACRGLNIKEASWARVKQRVKIPYLKMIYSHMAEKIGPSMPEKGFLYEFALQRGLGVFNVNSMGWGGATYDRDEATVTEIWLSPNFYRGFVTEDISEFLSGEKIPANTPLEDIYPEGLCLVGINDTPCDVRNECKDHVLSLGTYFPSATSAWGKGIWGAVFDQKLLNTAWNQATDMMEHLANKLRIINGSLVDDNAISGEIDNLIVAHVPFDVDVDKLISIKNQGGIDSGVINYIDRCIQNMEASARRGPAGMGRLDAGASPQAEQWKIDDAYMQGSLPLRLKGQTYAMRYQQVLNWAQKAFLTKRQIPVALQQEYNRIEIIELSAMDIDAELHVTFIDTTAIPLTISQKRNNLIQALQLGVNDENRSLSEREALSEAFMVPLSEDEITKQRRLWEMKYLQVESQVQKFEMFQQQYPDQASALLEPDPTEQDPFWQGMPSIIKEILNQPLVAMHLEWDNHQVYLSEIQRWYEKDKGYMASEFMKAVMLAWFHWHKQGRLQVQQSNSADAALATQPQVEAAQMAGSQLGGAALPATQFTNPAPQMGQEK